jgi:hypothetical protein
MSLRLAQSGHSNRSRECPLSGVKRTSEFKGIMSANNPKRTSTAVKSARKSAGTADMFGICRHLAVRMCNGLLSVIAGFAVATNVSNATLLKGFKNRPSD